MQEIQDTVALRELESAAEGPSDISRTVSAPLCKKDQEEH